MKKYIQLAALATALSLGLEGSQSTIKPKDVRDAYHKAYQKSPEVLDFSTPDLYRVKPDQIKRAVVGIIY